MSHVKIRNRKTGGVWDCPADAVEFWLDQPGWSKAAESADLTNDEAAVSAADPKEK